MLLVVSVAGVFIKAVACKGPQPARLKTISELRVKIRQNYNEIDILSLSS